MTTDVLTIALTLVGFVVGLVIALLYAGARSRSLREAHTARVNGMQADITARERELSDARAELATRTQEADASAAEVRALQSELGIERAQLQETQADMGAVADRLSAAEARLLTTDAQLADRGREVDEWSRAYALLRNTHNAVVVEHGEAEERRRRLEDDLQAQRLELAELGARMEALQGVAALQVSPEGDERASLQQRVTAISLLKATAEAGLRRRELELTEVRSQLSAMRFSINVLTSSAAELAALAGGSLFGVENPVAFADELPVAPRSVALLAEGDPAQQAEALAGLEAMIGDWFAEMRMLLPYSPDILRAFAGAAAGGSTLVAPAARAKVTGATGERVASGTAEAGDVQPAEVNGRSLPQTQAVPDLPPTLMLAAIKAAAVTSLERSTARQFELARRLTESQVEHEGLVTRIQAWRSMLHVTLQSDADLLNLLEKQDETDAAALLSACATVALTAYQKKQEALRRLEQRGLPSPVAEEGREAPRLSAPPPQVTARGPAIPSGALAAPTPSARFRRRNR